MKYKIHRSLSEQIREGCESRLNLYINPRWFSIGNVYPDCSHQRVMHMHELESAGPMVERMIRRFCYHRVGDQKMLSRWYSLRLGMISHYVCDFMCYVHTSDFDGGFREHRAYEQEQSAFMNAQCARAVCSFYEAKSSEELTEMLENVLLDRQKESYSPALDLEYAASVATELASSMLRICMEQDKSASWWYRLPVIRNRRVQHAS